MQLRFQLLDDVMSYNSLRPTEELFLTQGEAGDLYFQIISVVACRDALRYLPSSTAEVVVTFLNLDTNKEIVRTAIQVYPSDDRSIWRIPIQASDVIAPDSMRVALTEGGAVKYLSLVGSLRTTPSGVGQFFC